MCDSNNQSSLPVVIGLKSSTGVRKTLLDEVQMIRSYLKVIYNTQLVALNYTSHVVVSVGSIMLN